MRLVELFDKPATTWKWHDTGMGWAAVFKLGGRDYHVDMSGMPMFDMADDMHDQGLELPPEIEAIAKTDPVIYDASFYLHTGHEETSWQISGTGNEYKVFATVMAIIKEFLTKEPDTEYIHMAASEPSRIKLYNRMARASGMAVLTFKTENEQRYLLKV